MPVKGTECINHDVCAGVQKTLSVHETEFGPSTFFPLWLWDVLVLILAEYTKSSHLCNRKSQSCEPARAS